MNKKDLLDRLLPLFIALALGAVALCIAGMWGSFYKIHWSTEKLDGRQIGSDGIVEWRVQP